MNKKNPPFLRDYIKIVRTGFEPVNTVYGTEPTALNKIVPDGILFANRELNASTIPPPDYRVGLFPTVRRAWNLPTHCEVLFMVARIA